MTFSKIKYISAFILILLMIGNFLMYRNATAILGEELFKSNNIVTSFMSEYIDILEKIKKDTPSVDNEKKLYLQIKELKRVIKDTKKRESDSLNEVSISLSERTFKLNMLIIMILIFLLLYRKPINKTT